MGKLQIEDRRPQEEIGEDPKKEESPLALPPPQQEQGESSQDLPKDWKFVINHPQDQIIEFSKCMHSEFEMSMMGELNFFLGLQIKQLKEGTFINQAKYIRDILKRFNMEEAKTMKTPMSSSIKHDKDEKGKSIDSTMYRGMIESHLSAIKQILRYLKGTMDIGLWTSTQLSYLNLLRRRLAKRLGLTWSFSASWRIIKGPLQSDGLDASHDDFGVDFLDSDIAPVGLKVYESKVWPIMPGFKPKEVIQRMCGLTDAQRMGKPLSHNLTVSSEVLHHMICSILLPRGEHLDEVSYLEHSL
ncbi:hypothetical protein CK203_117774 [Vitis vinifera]|uniref:Reverse transcriptase Ty1/copia-type domain-containing protein n=1 Tax=Vitis vinifera TaxID=29760 RepID=A0A438FCH6_VITVI|nr:hypothetical protein CK203_117774 [Vitis vinifera]